MNSETLAIKERYFMKRTIKLAFLAIILLIALVGVGCAKEEPKAVAAVATPASKATVTPVTSGPKDGIYFAIDEEFASSGWKETATLTVSGGKITQADWNGVNISGGADKKTFDKAGKYNMVKFGSAQDEWSVQANRAEAFLLEKQDLKAINYKDAEGHTDDISGVSIHVSSMYALVEKALASGVQKMGQYADGSYYASEEAFGSNGWKGFVSLFVNNGNIVQVYYSGVNEAGDDKQVFASEGKYGMVAGSKIGKEWHEQAQATEAYLVANQDPKKVKFSNAEGNTDDIAGVSMHVGDFFTLTEKALAAGPKK